MILVTLGYVRDMRSTSSKKNMKLYTKGIKKSYKGRDVVKGVSVEEFLPEVSDAYEFL